MPYTNSPSNILWTIPLLPSYFQKYESSSLYFLEELGVSFIWRQSFKSIDASKKQSVPGILSGTWLMLFSDRTRNGMARERRPLRCSAPHSSSQGRTHTVLWTSRRNCNGSDHYTSTVRSSSLYISISELKRECVCTKNVLWFCYKHMYFLYLFEP